MQGVLIFEKNIYWTDFMNPKIRVILITILCGWLTCVLCGILFFGFKTMQTENPLFIFVIAGFLGSVAFALLVQNCIRDAFFGLIILSFFEVIFFGLKNPFIHILFTIALIVPLYIYARHVYKKLSFYKSVRPLIIAGMMTISFICATVIQHVIYASDGQQLIVFGNMPIGFLIGISLGFGFELAWNFQYR
jgi:hypothetical protein